MTGPAPAVAATRVAVRAHLVALAADHPGPPAPLVLAAVSGGADSLALAAALAFEAPRAGVAAGAVVVDHGLQPGSSDVAAAAAGACRDLGLHPVEVAAVDVARAGGGGPEARARGARHAALAEAAARLGAPSILLGHTRDDQAEQVLLGLARGAGTRSLSGMPAVRGLLRRPLLSVSRETTRAACAAQGLTPWSDPHNDDPRYLRVRARGALDRLEADLGPGVRTALARTADLARADADALDGWAARLRAGIGPGPWTLSTLAEVAAAPPAVRHRVWRLLALEAGCPAGDLRHDHVDAVDALVAAWSGQGDVALPGGRWAARRRPATGGRRGEPVLHIGSTRPVE